MKNTLFILFCLMILSVPSAGQDKGSPVGTWLGTLDVQGTQLRLGMIITEDGSGELKALFNSLDQGGTEFPADRVTFQKDTLTVSHAATGILIKGVVDPSGKTLDTRFSQMGFRSDLRFDKVEKLPD